MMAKHTQYDLKQMQSLPLEAKIKMTKQRIIEWYEYFDGAVYLAFSGGKDSTVLKHIIDSLYDDVPSVFCDTGLEYPEIRKFALSQPNTIKINPIKRFDQVITEYGYPVISKEVAKNVQYARQSGKDNVHYKKLFGLLEYQGEKSIYCTDKWAFLYDAPFKISAKCCDLMKKRPSKYYERDTGRKPIVATMAGESRQREKAWIRIGCNSFDHYTQRSAPISFWTEQDILHYLVKYNLDYCPIYGEIKVKDQAEMSGQINISDLLGIYDGDILETTGASRTGCIFCMFGCHLDKEPNRFQRLKKSHPKQYKYCINGGHYDDGMLIPDKDGLGLGKVLDYIGVKYG